MVDGKRVLFRRKIELEIHFTRKINQKTRMLSCFRSYKILFTYTVYQCQSLHVTFTKQLLYIMYSSYMG